jgi:hypothetical protein
MEIVDARPREVVDADVNKLLARYPEHDHARIGGSCCPSGASGRTLHRRGRRPPRKCLHGRGAVRDEQRCATWGPRDGEVGGECECRRFAIWLLGPVIARVRSTDHNLRILVRPCLAGHAVAVDRRVDVNHGGHVEKRSER